MIRHFALLNRDPKIKDLIEFIQQHELKHEIHLNRTRFWIPEGPVLTQFLLQFDSYHVVSADEDLANGRVLDR